MPVAVPLLAAVTAQILCQIFKVVAYSIRDHRFSPQYFTTAGGMPSAHSAFVTALTVAVGVARGFDSELFAVAFVFSAIVIYDAYRLRGHVEAQAKLLNRLQRDLPAEERVDLSEMVGHSVSEIVAGIAFGGLFAVAASAAFAAAAPG
ncbi:MAG: divergent PAP2 family protein [Spirochaetaceae bacterium]